MGRLSEKTWIPISAALTLCLGAVWLARLEARVEQVERDLTPVSVLADIKTDIAVIKEGLKHIKRKLGVAD